MDTIIDALIERHKKIIQYLEEKGEISLKIDSDNEFRRVLILSISSFFESEIIDAMLKLVEKTNSEKIISLIKIKVISRQYHTYFDWESSNVNKFLGLLGERFKEIISKEIEANIDLSKGAKAFLKIGEKRNILVHGNFASIPIDWTTEEIVEKYNNALNFVSYLSDKVKET